MYNNCALYMLLYKQCRGFYCCSTVNVRITAPLEFKRHFDTELVFSLYLKRLLYLLGLGAI